MDHSNTRLASQLDRNPGSFPSLIMVVFGLVLGLFLFGGGGLVFFLMAVGFGCLSFFFFVAVGF